MPVKFHNNYKVIELRIVILSLSFVDWLTLMTQTAAAVTLRPNAHVYIH